MAKVKCEYCGSWIQDTDEKCPNCGGTNENHRRTSDDTPKTIEELKNWYTAHGMADENITRIFIGKNITEAKAFGIYRDGENFIVYKNKADGTRAIRYQGTDEAYAVNELYLKIKERILQQKTNTIDRKYGTSYDNSDVYSYDNYRKTTSPTQHDPRSKKSLREMIIWIVAVILLLTLVTRHYGGPTENYHDSGYSGYSYYYDNDDYYDYDYEYDDDDYDWDDGGWDDDWDFDWDDDW